MQVMGFLLKLQTLEAKTLGPDDVLSFSVTSQTLCVSGASTIC